MVLQRLLHEGKSCPLVSRLGDVAFQHLALLVGCAPEVKHFGVDLLTHLIMVPLPLSESVHPSYQLAANATGEQRTEPVSLVLHRLVADVVPALRQQVLAIPQR